MPGADSLKKKSRLNSEYSTSSLVKTSNGLTTTTNNTTKCDCKQGERKRFFNFGKSKISVNQISHYITIVTLGFYLILSTIPFAILLSLQNNMTLKLNYKLETRSDYFTDEYWKNFGALRDWTAVAKLFFVSNHCFNFFVCFV